MCRTLFLTNSTTKTTPLKNTRERRERTPSELDRQPNITNQTPSICSSLLEKPCASPSHFAPSAVNHHPLTYPHSRKSHRRFLFFYGDRNFYSHLIPLYIPTPQRLLSLVNIQKRIYNIKGEHQTFKPDKNKRLDRAKNKRIWRHYHNNNSIPLSYIYYILYSTTNREHRQQHKCIIDGYVCLYGTDRTRYQVKCNDAVTADTILLLRPLQQCLWLRMVELLNAITHLLTVILE